jgi:PAS domain S-box-containing protein
MGLFADLRGLTVGPGEGMGGQVWESGVPVVVDDYRRWPWRLAGPAFARLRSGMGIPLKSGREVCGVIGLASVTPAKRFGSSDVEVLSRFAELALVALDKARLYEDLKRELGERRRAEAVVRDSERRYRSLLESSPDPIVVYDMHGAATYVNPAFTRVLGWSREELIGQRIDFVPAEHWPETRRAIRSMLAGETIQMFETRRRTKDGRILDVQISSTLYHDENGHPAGNIVILRDISEPKRTERQLKQYQEDLEQRVAVRTAELAASNRLLAREVDERRAVAEALRRREAELEAQSRHLAEVNTALKVLLKQRESDRTETQENVLANLKELVAPYLERLKKSRLTTDQLTLVRILETNLHNIVSPFMGRLGSKAYGLTPMEIRVANLVRAGRTNQEMAALLCVSKNTVMFHRFNIRRKLGLQNKKVNLATCLMGFEK